MEERFFLKKKINISRINKNYSNYQIGPEEHFHDNIQYKLYSRTDSRKLSGTLA